MMSQGYKSLKLPSNKLMRQMRFLEPRHKFTICAVLRDIYSKTDDPEIKLKCRYGVMLANSVVNKLAKYNKRWVRRLYPTRQEFDETFNHHISLE